MKLLAASEDHADIAKLNMIPSPPFIEKNIPNNPRRSNGIIAYPNVLMMLYNGII
mgnify:CR=1 FL=1